MNKFMTKEQYARIKKENGLVSFDGTNLKDADGNTIEVGGGGTTIELLWENASIGSSFGSQDISIEDLASYKTIVISGVDSNMIDIANKSDGIGTYGNYLLNFGYTTFRTSIAYRNVKRDNANNKITFAASYYRSFVENPETERGPENSRCIPFKIYGIKSFQ